MLFFKMRTWLWLTTFLCLLFILMNFPAGWVIYVVQKTAPGFQAANVSGSFWAGRVEYTQWVDRGRVLPLGELRWRLQPAGLLALHPCIHFSLSVPDRTLVGKTIAGQTITGQACHSLLANSSALEKVRVSLPIARIAPFFAVELDGSVNAYVTKAVLQSGQPGTTELTILWQRAALYNGDQWIPLGDLEGKVSDDGEGGLISQWKSPNLTDTSQPVKIELQARLTNLTTPKPTVRITGTINPGTRAEVLEPILRFVGEPTGDGSWRIDISE